MKPQFMRVAVLSALALTSPLLSLAAQPARLGMVRKVESRNPTDAAKAVQFGKGTGITRNQGIQANTIPFRPGMIAKPADRRADQSSAARTNKDDLAFRK
jgi:hypothetical protein